MRTIVAALLVTAVAPCAFAKSTVQVGACLANTTASTSTIQAAVDTVGVGGTVMVCPGTYPEQVIISKNVTLRGVLTGTASSQATVAAPASGLAVNAMDLDYGEPTAAQIVVMNASAVNIDNITVDGSNNNVTSCGIDVVGILYQNASGTITGNWVKNQIQPGGYSGCQGGLAIYAESSTGTSTVNVTGNIVEGFQKNGVTGDDPGTSMAIANNTILGNGPTTQGAAENGIQVAYGATATISTNIVGDEIWAPDVFGDTGDAAAGILVYDSEGVSIKSNNVSSTQYGIAVVSDGGMPADYATISGNNIRATHLYDAVDICGAGNAMVTSNTMWASDESAVHLDSTCGTPSTGNTVTNNTVNGACAGVLTGMGSSGYVNGNKFTNVAAYAVPGDVCPAAQSPSAQTPVRGHHHLHVSPFR